jgi:hypothetical protein
MLPPLQRAIDVRLAGEKTVRGTVFTGKRLSVTF